MKRKLVILSAAGSEGTECSSTYISGTEVSFDGEKYTAIRSDGTRGSGNYLLVLSGTMPIADSETEFVLLSDKKYSFEDISRDINGLTDVQLPYFLL